MHVFGGKVKVGWWQVGLALIQVQVHLPISEAFPSFGNPCKHCSQYSQGTKPNQKQFQHQYILAGLIKNASNHSGFPTQQRRIMHSFLTALNSLLGIIQYPRLLNDKYLKIIHKVEGMEQSSAAERQKTTR